MPRICDLFYPDDLDETKCPDWFIGDAELYFEELELDKQKERKR